MAAGHQAAGTRHQAVQGGVCFPQVYIFVHCTHCDRLFILFCQKISVVQVGAAYVSITAAALLGVVVAEQSKVFQVFPEP